MNTVVAVWEFISLPLYLFGGILSGGRMVRLIRGSLGRYSARMVRRVDTTSESLYPKMACDDCCDLMLQADKDKRAKEEKIRIAMQKIKAADIKKVRHEFLIYSFISPNFRSVFLSLLRLV